MKTPRWLLHLAIVLINCLRLLISVEIFIQFFYFRMVNVTCLFIFYLLLDSVEGIIVFYRRDSWGPLKIILYYFNYTVFLFVIIAGILMYQPLLHFLMFMGFEIEELETIKVWITVSAIVFLFMLLFGWAMQSNWGNIQNFALRFSFLIYCSWFIPWWGIILSLISAACIIGVEIKKYGWRLKELRKKDYRFRHLNPVVPPYQKQHKPPLD